VYSYDYGLFVSLLPSHPFPFPQKLTTPPLLGVMAELERLGPKYRIALRIARDPRPCASRATRAGSGSPATTKACTRTTASSTAL